MARTLKSTLSGVWLMQTIKMSVPVPCRVEYTVRHKGSGKNDLRVRFGNYVHLIWGQVHDFDLDAGRSGSRSTDIANDRTGSNDGKQDVRWRLSRAALTKAIDWELTYTVTRLESDDDVSGDCEPTVTSEE